MAEINREMATHNKHMVRAKPEFNMCDLAVQVRTSGGSMISQREGAPTSEFGVKTLLCAQDFSRKLHENERNSIKKRGGALAPPWIRQCESLHSYCSLIIQRKVSQHKDCHKDRFILFKKLTFD